MVVFVAAAAAEPAPVPVVPYYDTTERVTVVSALTARRQLAQKLREEGLELYLERADGVTVPVRPSSPSLDDAVVASALTPFLHDLPGAELDLVAGSTETFLVLLTSSRP